MYMAAGNTRTCCASCRAGGPCRTGVGATESPGPCPVVVFPAMPGAVEHCGKLGIVRPDPRFGCCIDAFSRTAAAASAKPAPGRSSSVGLIVGAALIVGVAYLAGGM